MKKAELEKLITRITGLEPEDQLKLANALVSELNLNEESLEDAEYNKSKSNEVSNILYQLINNLQDDIKKTKLLSLISEVKELPSEYQDKLVTRLINLIHRLQKEYHQGLVLNECKTNGHIFTEWKKITWTTKEVVWDAGPQGYVQVEHARWERSCSRCGYTESVEKEPDEVRETRLENERQAEIKILEKRLATLKNKQLGGK